MASVTPRTTGRLAHVPIYRGGAVERDEIVLFTPDGGRCVVVSDVDQRDFAPLFAAAPDLARELAKLLDYVIVNGIIPERATRIRGAKKALIAAGYEP